MSKEIVIGLAHQARQVGFSCPTCGGLGTRADGRLNVSPTEIRVTPASKCSMCAGYGRVKLVAFTAAEWEDLGQNVVRP
jgi:hypothetical protein